MNGRISSHSYVLLTLALFTFACSDSGPKPSDATDVGVADQTGDVADLTPPVDGTSGDAVSTDKTSSDATPTDVTEEDVTPEDVTTATDSDATAQDAIDAFVPPEVFEDGSSTDGGAPFGGIPCSNHDECSSGFCAPTPDGKICSSACNEECPDGWTCREYKGNEKVCMNDDVNLCRPCLTNEACLSGGGAPGDFCVNLGPYIGSFCGTSCSSELDCGSGYQCKSVDLGSPQPIVLLCIPDAGECNCSDWAIEEGANTICGLGTCVGVRECLPNGTLLACTAQQGGFEICDGIDNDCDGDTDENFPGVGNPCDGPDDDFCFSGLWSCNEDPTSDLLVCTDGVLDTLEEYCDGQDNDCDGETDEDFPEFGLPCDGPDPDGCANGTLVCSEDLRYLVCEEDPSLNQVEDCNGVDDDCDGQTDEGEICAGGPNTQEGIVALDGIEGILYRSLDHGESWQVLATLPIPTPALINMTRTGTKTLYVFTSQNKLVMSEDSGLTWNEQGNWGNVTNFTICAHPSQQILYGTDSSGVFYKSTDKGLTFTPVGEWDTYGSSMECAVNPDGVILISDANYANQPVKVSLDGGVSFTLGAPIPTVCSESGTLCDTEADCPAGESCWLGGGNNASITVDESGAFYSVGNWVIYRTVDDGASWDLWSLVPANNSPLQIQDIVAGDDGYMYGATPNAGSLAGHTYSSANGGVDWVQGGDWKGSANSSGWVEIETVYFPIITP